MDETKTLGGACLCLPIAIINTILWFFIPRTPLKVIYDAFSIPIFILGIVSFIFVVGYFADIESDSIVDTGNRYLSTETRRKVWKRDNGRCVQCGSQERLEFDHIIPFSKGGSNTTRNIQLLCE